MEFLTLWLVHVEVPAICQLAFSLLLLTGHSLGPSVLNKLRFSVSICLPLWSWGQPFSLGLSSPLDLRFAYFHFVSPFFFAVRVKVTVSALHMLD